MWLSPVHGRLCRNSSTEFSSAMAADQLEITTTRVGAGLAAAPPSALGSLCIEPAWTSSRRSTYGPRLLTARTVEALAAAGTCLYAPHVTALTTTPSSGPPAAISAAAPGIVEKSARSRRTHCSAPSARRSSAAARAASCAQLPTPRCAISTLAPSIASIRATALPMPLVAPTTSIRLPRSEGMPSSGITGAPRRARTPRSMAQPGQHSREGCWKRRAASAEGTPPAQAARAALGHSRSAPGEAPPAAWRSRPEGPATGCDCSAQAARDTAAEARPLAAGPSKGTAHAARPSSVHPMRCGVSNTSAASVPLLSLLSCW
mmetsp:Transcript_28947/g.72658  ORF Transcript_28947/g.72658 Transcript_28947/m.72658 type:complete len:318 (+) Transcript_28947:995-1948(+)